MTKGSDIDDALSDYATPKEGIPVHRTYEVHEENGTKQVKQVRQASARKPPKR